MAEKVPLNFYKRITSSLSRAGSAIYTVPFDRASIILNTLTTSNTNDNKFITISLSGNTPNNITLLNRFPFDSRDVINLTPQKLILSERDSIIVTSDFNDIATLNDLAMFWEFNLPSSLVTLDDFTVSFTIGTEVTADFGTENLNVTTSLVTLTSDVPVSYFYDIPNETDTNITLSILEVDNRP